MRAFFIITLAASIAPFVRAEVPEDVRTRVKAATVKVTSEMDRQFGSGVVIAQSESQSYVLTAQHLVPTAKKVEVKVPGGKIFTAEVLASSSEADLAVLRILTSKEVPAPIKLAAKGTKPKNLLSTGWEKGDAPNCLDESLKRTVRLKRPGETNAVLCWEMERKPAAGRSGGALVDEGGQVLGVASGHDGTSGYYVHFDEIQAFLRLNGLKWLTEGERP